MIQKNLYNPIPFHSSKDQWYNRRRTFKGGVSQVIVPTGHILPFQITLSKNTNYILPQFEVTMQESGTAIQYVRQMPFDGDKMLMKKNEQLDETDYFELWCENGKFRLVYVEYTGPVSPKMRNEYFYIENGSAITWEKTLLDFDKVKGLSYSEYTMYKFGNNTYSIKRVSFATSFDCVTCKLMTMNDTAVTAETYDIPLAFSLVPSAYRNDTRYMYAVTNNTTIAGVSDGCYYIKITIPKTDDPNEYIYSEPFEMRSDFSSLIHAYYKTDNAIVKSSAYLPFRGVLCGDIAMEAYIDSYIMMPSCSFEEEVQDLNGYHFIQSRVSAIAHKFSFLATAYFAEAIILMWHCSLLRFHDGVDEYLVDYMKQPELSWNDDNHLAQVDVEFLTDTITQSEGYHVATTSRVTGGQFSEGFSNGFGV